MIKLMTFVLLMLFVTESHSQYFEGFEENCSDYSKPFLDQVNCYPDWVNANGSPDTQGFNEAGIPVEAIEGNRYVHMYVNQDGDCTNFSQKPYGDRGEGIALNYPFQMDQEYTIRYYDRFGQNGSFFGQWILTDGLTENYASAVNGPKCAPGGDHVPDIPPVYQEVNMFNWAVSGIWKLREFTFVANANYSQLWLRVDNGYTNANLDRQSHILIDAFEIVCGHENTAPEFSFVDKYGTLKDQFCYGEDIWINIEDNEYPYIWLGAADFDDPGWLPDYNNEGLLNISQIYRDKGLPPFSPDKIYTIKIAIDHPDCGWIERTMKVEYVCCELDANFMYNIDDTSTGEFAASSTFDYSLYGGTHSFCLYIESPEGTLTQVSCSNSPSFLYASLAADVRYHIVHEVATLCGTECVSVDFCSADNGCAPTSVPDACEHLNSCIGLAVDGLSCPVPKTNHWFTEYTISWNSVPDAAFYQISTVSGDPDCGCVSDLQYSGTSWSTSNEAFIGGGECFSYRVRAKCENGYGPWSDKICFPNCEISDDENDDHDDDQDHENDDDKDDREIGKRSIIADLILEAYPNPFTNELTISLGVNLNKEAIVELRDLMGQLIRTSIIRGEKMTISTDDITPGIYLLVLHTKDGKTLTKKLIKS